MAKGIAAFVVVLAPILAISMLSGIGYFDAWGVDYSGAAADEDVQAAADALTSQKASDTSSSAIVEFTTGSANAFQSFWQIISNTSGVLKLLFGLPDVIATKVETVFRITFGITFAGFIRGVLL